MRKRIGALATGLLLLGAIAAVALTVIFTRTLINESALAYSKNFPLDTSTVYIGSNLAGSMSYSTATLTADTFTDGAQSTGSFTVGSVSGLVCAAASDTLTIGTNLSAGAYNYVMVTLPGSNQGFQFTNGVDFVPGSSTANTATNIAAAMAAALPNVTVTHPSNTVVLTANFCGALYNNATLFSNTSSMTVTGANWAGGVDNAVVSINGYKLRQGTDWSKVSTTTGTAANIVTAISANANISKYVTASRTNSTVNITSKVTGVNAFLLASNTANITKSGANMTGGSNPSWKLGGTSITIPNHNLTLAYPVLYSQGSAPLASGLTDQTTYYAYIVDPNTIKLADTSAHAVAGTNFRVLSSTSSQTTADTYTLSPLAFTGSASAQWQTSDDNSSWTNMSGISAVTINATGSTSWSTLDISHRYIRMAVTGPTTGGAQINLTLTGTQ